MTTATLDYDTTAIDEQNFEYRALHTGAILGLVLSLVSVFIVFAAGNSLEGALFVAPIPLIGMLVSIWSLKRINAQPENYTGKPLAVAGLALSTIFFFGGIGYAGYVYATEVPEGYTRISFNGMKPSAIQERNGVAIPPDIAALDGKKVFIKGYIRPDSTPVMRGIDRFLLVRDNNQCCFGDLSTVKYYDQILVDMSGSRRLDYRDGVFRMGGILKIEPQNVALGSRVPVFSLKADYAK